MRDLNDAGTAGDAGEGMERREVFKAIAAAAASLPILETLTPGTVEAQTPATARPAVSLGGPRGTPSDPDLLHPKKEWRRLLSARELATLSVLCDTIIPADRESPSASAVGVPAYINEVVSAPVELGGRPADLVRLRGGLVWLDTESSSRFGKTFTRLTAAQRAQICDDICYRPKAKPEFEAAAHFFDMVRDLCASGFYSTTEGMQDLKYVGNMAMPEFPPPPKAVLRKLGLL